MGGHVHHRFSVIAVLPPQTDQREKLERHQVEVMQRGQTHLVGQKLHLVVRLVMQELQGIGGEEDPGLLIRQRSFRDIDDLEAGSGGGVVRGPGTGERQAALPLRRQHVENSFAFPSTELRVGQRREGENRSGRDQ